MSYRSLKRVLGETSLERKCRFLFGGCLFVLITGSFWWYGRSTEELVYEASRESARGLVESIIVMHHFKFWQNDEDERYGGQKFAELVEDLGKGLASRQYHWKLIRPVDDAENGAKDESDWRALKQFMRRPATPEGGATPEFEFMEQRVIVDNQPEYQYYTPIRITNRQCALCHASLNLGVAGMAPQDVGDLVAVAKVSLPDGKTQDATRRNKAILLGTAIFTVALAMWVSYAIVRYVIVKPLAHLRDVSERISHGDISLRAELHTGDEFEKLATAFNRMLRQLATGQEELTSVNDDLNTKVDELAQANMRLYEMNRLKSDFLATMSRARRSTRSSASATCSSRSLRSTTNRNVTFAISRIPARCCWK
jgi:two-component system sensor histidine kinase BarA